MGNSYTIVEQEGVKLECDEMSSRFGLTFTMNDGPYDNIQDLEPEKLVEAAVELLKVASYYMDTKNIQERINIHTTNKGGYMVGVAV